MATIRSLTAGLRKALPHEWPEHADGETFGVALDQDGTLTIAAATSEVQELLARDTEAIVRRLQQPTVGALDATRLDIHLVDPVLAAVLRELAS